MNDTLKYILQLETDSNFEAALNEYRQLFRSNIEDLELWKFYYFFLWYISVEDIALGLENFNEENQINFDLLTLTKFGIENYSNNPEALFVMGYTVSVYPYIFPELQNWEDCGRSMLEKASNLVPLDDIYKLAYLGSHSYNEPEYNALCKQTTGQVKSRFRGNGLLNSYFIDVLDRASQ